MHPNPLVTIVCSMAVLFPSTASLGADAAKPAAPAGVAPMDLGTPEGVYAALNDEARTRPLTEEQLSTARNTIDAASAAAPDDARWMTCRAILMRGQGRAQEVADLMARAVELAPTNPRVQMWYGIGATALYWALYRYYRNTDKSHAFERETTVEAKPVTGSDTKVDTVTGTRETRISGDNVHDYRARVQRDGG